MELKKMSAVLTRLSKDKTFSLRELSQSYGGGYYLTSYHKNCRVEIETSSKEKWNKHFYVPLWNYKYNNIPDEILTTRKEYMENQLTHQIVELKWFWNGWKNYEKKAQKGQPLKLLDKYLDIMEKQECINFNDDKTEIYLMTKDYAKFGLIKMYENFGLKKIQMDYPGITSFYNKSCENIYMVGNYKEFRKNIKNIIIQRKIYRKTEIAKNKILKKQKQTFKELNKEETEIVDEFEKLKEAKMKNRSEGVEEFKKWKIIERWYANNIYNLRMYHKKMRFLIENHRLPQFERFRC